MSNTPTSIIQRYCGDIEADIATCRSREEAENLKERICARFEKACKSELIYHVLRHRIDELIAQRFGIP